MLLAPLQNVDSGIEHRSIESTFCRNAAVVV